MDARTGVHNSYYTYQKCKGIHVTRKIMSIMFIFQFDKYKYAASLFVWNEVNVLWIIKYENNIIYEICVPLI